MLTNRRGFSLIELLLVIAVSAMITLVAVRYFSSSRFNLKITSATAQIEKISNASYRWLTAQKQLDFSGANSATGIPISITQLLNAQLINSNDTKDPWGGTIVINADPTTPAYVQIRLPAASLTACNNLKQRLANTARSQIAACTNNSGYTGSF